MAEVKSVDAVAEKWARVTPTRAADYEAGVRSPRKDWQQATVAATDAWKTGVQTAITQGSFAKGVNRAGTGTWQAGAIDKGVARWGPGVQIGQEAYKSGIAPYIEAIKRVTLPPRFARRDPRNVDRVRVIAEALAKVKQGLG